MNRVKMLPIKKQAEVASSPMPMVSIGNSEAVREIAAYCDPANLDANRGAELTKLMNGIKPHSKRERIKRSFEWAKKDDFLGSLLKIKSDFSLTGCNFQAIQRSSAIKISSGKAYSWEPPKDITLEDSHVAAIEQSGKMQDFILEMQLAYDLDAIVRTLVEDWFTSETMILYWRTDDEDTESSEIREFKPINKVAHISALNPKACDWDNSLGQDVLYYEIPQDLIVRVQRVFSMRESAEKQEAIKSLAAEIPIKWINAIRKNQRLVQLSTDDGDHWIVLTKNRSYEGFADPTMQLIFPWLTVRSLLKDGEVAMAYMMKYFIMHVTAGESIEHGEKCGSRENWATDKETEALQKMLNRVTSAARIATNHTVKFQFVYPPNEMWSREKYESPETVIARWIGVVKVVSEGDGSTGSSGHIGVKQLIADIAYVRSRIQLMFMKFFTHPTIRKGVGERISDDYIVFPQFDQNILKDPRQILDELKFLFQFNAIDPESALRETGRDPNIVRGRKTQAGIENQETGVWRPLHERSEGQFSSEDSEGNPEGRPANEGTTRDSDTRNQPNTK